MNDIFIDHNMIAAVQFCMIVSLILFLEKLNLDNKMPPFYQNVSQNGTFVTFCTNFIFIMINPCPLRFVSPVQCLQGTVAFSGLIIEISRKGQCQIFPEQYCSNIAPADLLCVG